MTDTFTARLIDIRLNSTTREMATTIVQTSGSPAITEAKDFSTALFNSTGTMVAFGGYVATHIGAAMEGVRLVREAFDEADISSGDGFLVNDPYTSGALHVGDMGIVWPIFFDGQIVAWAYANAHQMDVGGMSPGGLAANASDCFSEGLMFPPTRVVKDGKLDAQWQQFIANNVRAPINVIGDLQSLVAANRTAERRVVELLTEFGRVSFDDANMANQNDIEKVIRNRLASLPDTRITLEEWIDYERAGETSVHKLVMDLEIKNGTMSVDLSRSGEQASAPINTCAAAVIGGIYMAFAQKIASDLPLNAGTFRPIDIQIGGPGTLVNPTKPAPNSIGHVVTGARIVRGISSLFTTLLQASELEELRSQVAGTASDGLVRGAWLGQTDAGEPFAFLGQDQIPGLGARAKGDGLDVGGLQFGLGIEIADLEISETLYPVLYLWRRLSANSGGAGTNRGGMGVDLAWTPYGTSEMKGTLFCTVSRFPGRGELGGLPGSTGYMSKAGSSQGPAANSAELLQEYWDQTGVHEWGDLPSYGADIKVHAGEVVRVWSPGGGGLGNPAARAGNKVDYEVQEGWITNTHAQNAYGITLKNGAEGPAQESEELVLPLKRSDDDARRCGYCDHTLGRWDQPLADFVNVSETDLVEYLADREVRIKDDLPGRILRTLECPKCETALDRQIDWSPPDDYVEKGRGLYAQVN